MSELSQWLQRLDACTEAIQWASGFENPKRAWMECGRGDWMLWILARAGADRKEIVLAACDCAELALRFVAAGEDRPRAAIAMARRWCRGEVGLEEVRTAAAAAYAAAAADGAAYATAAAYATTAAYATAAADGAAAYATAAADGAAAKKETQQRCAEIVRQRFSWENVQPFYQATL